MGEPVTERPVGTRGGLALVTCTLVSAWVYAAPDPNPNLRSALAFHDLGHVGAFGLVTLVLAFAMGTRHSRMFSVVVAGSTALAIGAAIELAQAMTGGNGDVWDIFRDAGGASWAGLLWLAGSRGMAARARLPLAAASLLVLAAFTLPTLSALTDENRARAQFPLLVGFENTRDLSRFVLRSGVEATLEPVLNDERQAVPGMRVRLPPGRYPGVMLRYFPRDWSGMRALRLLLVNPDSAPWTIGVRIDDDQYDYRLDLTDRYDRSFVLQPGTNLIDIPLEDVAAAPRGRRFDLARVKLLIVYAFNLSKPREILVGPIGLRE